MHQQPAVVTQQTNWQDARDAAVIQNLTLVRAIAIRVHESLPVNVDLEDLIHAGVLGLFDAAEKYDASKNVSFQNYAKHRIKGSILDSLRELDWASRDLRKRQKQVEGAVHELSNALGRTPTGSEVAGCMGVSLERWQRISMELSAAGPAPATAQRLPEGEHATAEEFPAAPDSRPDRICERCQLQAVLERAIGSLPKRYQKVVVLYYTNAMTMKEIGNVLGVNESRVSQIHKTALQKMAIALESEGIRSARAL